MKQLVLSHHARLSLCDYNMSCWTLISPSSFCSFSTTNYYYDVQYDISHLSCPPPPHAQRWLFICNTDDYFNNIVHRNVCETGCRIELPLFLFSVFTPRVVSTAVARYNFAARDMRELSLREGDIVKIYSKIGGDQGWWKGEANGRVSKPLLSGKKQTNTANSVFKPI